MHSNTHNSVSVRLIRFICFRPSIPFKLTGDATLCLVTIWHRFECSLAASSHNRRAILQYVLPSGFCKDFGRIITCGVLVEIPIGRKLCRILHAEFRPKSLRDSACTISSVTYAEFCMQSFGRNPRIMLRAEIRPKRQQIYGRNLHIILLQTLGRSLCRLIHAECFAKSWVVFSWNLFPHVPEISAELCIQNFGEHLRTNNY